MVAFPETHYINGRRKETEGEKTMRKIGILLFVTLATVAIAAPNAPAAKAPAKAAPKAIVWPADKIVYKQAIPGVSRAEVWGSTGVGPYEAITKFAKGQLNDWHTHSSDIHIVVISGTMIFNDGSGEKHLGPGSYLLQPAGQKHISGCTKDADCTFVEVSPGKFDMTPAKK
jgi:mannose-6-phosphate isomerase-like protein (cupin superfamily)